MDQSDRCFLALIAFLDKKPKSMIDVGCGNGHIVRLAASLGIFSIGIDNNLPKDKEYFENGSLFNTDLIKPHFWEPYVSNLAICWEVGEHLQPEDADPLCDMLIEVTGETLVFTAAKKNQGGAGHFNEQNQEYWRRKLEARGLIWKQKESQELSKLWYAVAPIAWWYAQNVQVFKCTK
jgi:hypothetical protein